VHGFCYFIFLIKNEVVQNMSGKANADDFTKLPQNYQSFHQAILAVVPAVNIFVDPIRTLAYGVDASFYRITPKMVVKVRRREEITAILKAADQWKVSVTFRTAGTSLSGQALTDSVLLVLAGGWDHYEIGDQGKTIVLEPGIIGAEANSYLAPYSHKIGPDPASINHAMIGGMAANNSSGMCCGTADNSYKTVKAMKIIFADGTLLDTGDQISKNAFVQTHAKLIADILAIRAAIHSDPELVTLIQHKYKIKNTTGYSINAFVDYADVFDIINHLLIGSEGTLGFIAEITYNTVPEPAYKASALMIFPDMNCACQAVIELNRPLVAAAEFLDRVSLRSVEDQAGMPEYIKTLGEGVTALLVETRAAGQAVLADNITTIQARLASIPTVYPIAFTDKKAEYDKLWRIRAGVFPAVGGMRDKGTTVIIEDVAFPKERLAEALTKLRIIMDGNGYQSGIIYGHALDGNVHFVFNQDFNRVAEVTRYKVFLQAVCDMVIHDFDGSLKAEHGTGRNMAPFVEFEWGKKAYHFMKSVKAVFDPRNLINPGVIITDNYLQHIENLKPMPVTNETIDKCIECGYCEVMCPSKNLTSTPRQRIAVSREIARLQTTTGADQERLARLQRDYAYFGDETCAADGLCETTCPLSINTGTYTKYFRSLQISSRGKNIAKFMTTHFAGVTSFARLGLAGAHLAHQALGTCAMEGLAGGARKISNNRIPKWTKWLPKVASTPYDGAFIATGERNIVYFPSCVSRTMGPAKDDHDQRSLSEVMLSLLKKAGYRVIYPENRDQLCCGMPFESKGYFAAADEMSDALEVALLKASNNGSYPILCDTSPCVYRMKTVLTKQLTILDTVEFIHDHLLGILKFEQLPETVAVHITCSATKMGISNKFRAVAAACASKVITPEKVRCCGFAGDRGFTVPELNESALGHLVAALPADCHSGYSNSRTCEIGLAEASGISYQSIAYLVDRCTTR
jgi:D-lactate dehydrogenase